MHMHVTGPEELCVLEVVVFKVFQAVAHVRFATEELFFPQHLAVAPDPTGARQALRQVAHAQLRPERTGAQFRMRQIQVVATFHDMVGVFITNGEAQTIRLAVMTDHIQAAQLGLFPAIFGKGRQRKRMSGAHDNAAITLVEPLWLNTGLPRSRLAAFDAPFENTHGVGHRSFVSGLLVHLVACRRTAQMGQPGAADQQVRRIRMVERRQDPQLLKQLRIVVRLANATLLDLVRQSRTRLDCRQRQLANTFDTLDLTYLITVDQTDPALTVAQFKLY